MVNLNSDDESIEVQPVVDRDTVGIPGAPDIAETIFAKIDRADIFVCDVSILHRDVSRPAPNPNVLIELGYARKSLGVDRIIMVMNTAFGGPELLPFDLRARRIIPYQMSPEAEERATERRRLEAVFKESLRTIFDQIVKDQPTDIDPLAQARDAAIKALEDSLPNQTLLADRFVQLVWTKLAVLAPLFPGTGQNDSDEFVVHAIEQTVPLVTEFSRLCEVMAAVNSIETIRKVYTEFGRLIDELNTPSGFSGSSNPDHGDYYRFIGHELFVTFLSFLLREQRWSLITELLEEEIYVRNSPSGRSGTVPFTHLSDCVESLRRRNQRLNLRRVSLHADILNERHTTGEMSNVVPMRQFMDADYFLYLREDFGWTPWSTLYIGSQAPRYLAEAVTTKRAEQLLQPLRVRDIAALRTLVSERNAALRQLFRGTFAFFPLEDFAIQRIGSK